MKPFTSSGMSYDGSTFFILDQTLLPHREEWLPCRTTTELVHIIKRLAIRGAPAIGISSSILLALHAQGGMTPEELRREAATLRSARPTAVNLGNNIDRIVAAMEDGGYPESVVAEAERIYDEDIELCDAIACHGISLIQKGERILTHCHTGSIATAGRGTALGIIAAAHEAGREIFVWIDETRPLLQGARLTAWECLRYKIPHALICDNMAATLMAGGRVDRVLVGSDRIAANGDFANKIGTYSLAVLAHYHKVPFYVAAPQTTVDPDCPSGKSIIIEERDGEEIKGVKGGFGSCCWAPEDIKTYNPAFDVTPAELVSGWILDSGVFHRRDITRGRWWEKRPPS